MISRIGLLFAAMCAVACDKAPTTPQSIDVPFAASLDQAAARAASSGDATSAGQFTTAAAALRFGIQPSDIMVAVHGEYTRYHALVVGVVEKLAAGDTAIRRSLVAWAGDERTIATLNVSTLGDVGSFSSPSEPASDPRSRAEGTWVDLVRDSRWIATTGTAQLTIAGIRSDCPSPRFGDLRCVVATYDVFIDGLFRLNGATPDEQKPAVRIQTDARGVNGVLLADGGAVRTPVISRAPVRKPNR
jgi:hypothetical protein